MHFSEHYSPSPEYPAARRRHSGFGASATCCRELHYGKRYNLHLQEGFGTVPPIRRASVVKKHTEIANACH
jgi:hypothetical protein